ncbi:hypothetical protein CPB84DRAFT_1773814 [Gymnopilus junonius]|uniref:Uncharacterized protein n=1 Tax=Gymnopilus junonius TaxID=109634 RepID=A0A9P5TNX4_GYMJU|nr:hypothetical protein CPB84DRAFT_1773814 [Gymnopilus junonius]
MMADPALAQITEEKSWYVADYISNLLLGIQISLVIQSMYYLAYGHYTPKRKVFFIGCSILLLMLGLLMWITHCDVAGGPVAYLAKTFSA